MKILVINAGSSSLKYQLIDMTSQKPLSIGLIERIGIEGGTVKHDSFSHDKKERKTINQFIKNHKEALSIATNLLLDKETGSLQNANEVSAVGHRVVHGGEFFSKATLIDESVKNKIENLITLAPLHNGANLTGIQVAEVLFPKAKHVAVFDTSYHQSMPEKAYRYAIPNNFYTEHNIRRYGMHGTSHQYVYEQASSYLKNPNLKAITLHLGNGASMAAIDSNKVMDTSMGLGPLAGLIMGTRCGDIDPSVIFYMNEELNIPLDEIKTIFNKKSGMLGLTGSSDARDIEARYNNNEAEAILANEMYAYRIQKYIGSYLATLNGAETLIFTGGIGENDSLLRGLICKGLDFFGIQIDENANQEKNHPEKVEEIHSSNSRLKILLIPTNEELQIANETAQYL